MKNKNNYELIRSLRKSYKGCELILAAIGVMVIWEVKKKSKKEGYKK